MSRFSVMHCQDRYGNWRKVIRDTEAWPPVPVQSRDVTDHVCTTDHDTRAEAVMSVPGQRATRVSHHTRH